MTMTEFSKLFIDTNALIFATNIISPWYHAANESLQTAGEAGIELFVSPQVLREYLAAATRLKIRSQALVFAMPLEQ